MTPSSPPSPDSPLALTGSVVQFPGSLGAELTGRIDHPKDRAPTAWAIFAPCFTCTSSINAASRTSRGLAERGFGVLRFDFTGLGRSEGEFKQTTFASNVDDLVAAASWLEQEHAPASLLVGHSLGGAAVLNAAGRIESVTAVATVGAPADPAHVHHLIASHVEQIERDGSATVNVGGRPVEIGSDFVHDLERHDPEAVIGALRCAILVAHSPTDTIVGIENAADIYAWAKHPKSFLSLGRAHGADADHLLSDMHDASYFADVLATWAARHLA